MEFSFYWIFIPVLFILLLIYGGAVFGVARLCGVVPPQSKKHWIMPVLITVLYAAAAPHIFSLPPSASGAASIFGELAGFAATFCAPLYFAVIGTRKSVREKLGYGVLRFHLSVFALGAVILVLSAGISAGAAAVIGKSAF